MRPTTPRLARLTRIAYDSVSSKTVSTIERDAISLTVHYEDAGDGWVLATILEVPGAISQGRTRAEARANVIDALQTVLTPDDKLAGRTPAADDERLTLTVAE